MITDQLSALEKTSENLPPMSFYFSCLNLEFQNHPLEEELFEHYFALSAKVKDLDISRSHASLDALSLEIYDELLLKRNELMDEDLKSKKCQ